MQQGEAVNILLVDDREENLITLEAVLGSSQYNLVTATSGLQALEILPTRDFALVLLDVQMPVIDGFETARRIRAQESTRHLPIIFLTAINRDDSNIHRGYDMGAVDYLFKPFDMVVLRSKVAVFADLYRKNMKIREQERLLEAQYLRSETRFRAFFDQSSLPMELFSTDGSLIEVNSAWENLFETSKDAANGYNLFEDPQLKSNGVIENIKEGFQGKQVEVPPFLFTPSGNGNTGRSRWIRTHIYPVKDVETGVREIAVILSDVTEPMMARRKLEDSERRFRTLADALPQLVWTAGADGRPDYGNARWKDYFGHGDEWIGEWADLIHPEDLPKAEERLNRSLKSGELYEIEYRLREKSGGYRWFLARAVPLVNKEKGTEEPITRWFGTCTDITERVEAQALLEKAVRSRDEFLSIASHELRTPVTSMSLSTQMLKRHMHLNTAGVITPERIRKMLDQSERQLDRLTRLIKDMLDISRINTGRFTLKTESVNLAELIADTLERLQPQLQAAGCQARSTLDPDIVVQCDRYRVEQALTNLLTNALRYAPGKPFELTLGAKENWVSIMVKDAGPGIAQVDQKRIFDRFERAISVNEVSGLGLGLFIVTQIMRAHGGRVRVESSLGEGSAFILELPFQSKSTLSH